MNVHALQEDESRYLLFAIKKVLDERDILPPTQVQFYESVSTALREKLQRIDRAGEGYPDPPTRNRFAKVRPSWDPESLAQVSRDLANNT